MDHVLTWMIFIPLLGAVVVLCLPRGAHELDPLDGASAFTVPPLLLAIWLFATSIRDGGLPVRRARAVDRVLQHRVLRRRRRHQHHMVLLTALLSFLCMLASWGIEKAVKGYFALFLLLETGMMGVFVALDFFLFYVFWEVMLLPMYFLIGIWGGPRREYAAIKFFLYTLLGSVLMLLAMLVLYFTTATPHTFDMTKLARRYVRRLRSRSTSSMLLWIGAVHRLRDQDPDVPVPHLAARRARRGADGDLGHPRRRAAQDGHLRHPAHQLRHPAGGDAPTWAATWLLARRSARSTSSTARSAPWRRRT